MELIERKTKLILAMGDIAKATGALNYLATIRVEDEDVKARIKKRILEIEKANLVIRAVYDDLSRQVIESE